MKRRWIACGALCAVLLAFDRLTKAWAARVLVQGRMTVIPGVVSFQYAENTGAAFGIFSGLRLLNGLLTLALLIALAAFIWQMRGKKGIAESGAVIMAGGISHLYDRLLGRNIIDFIKTEFMDFPIFNVADICICVGAFLLAAVYLYHDSKARSKRT